MSIWSSWPAVGYGDAHGDEDTPRGGMVLSYAAGFSNHYPDPASGHETPATVSLAHIAPWCVPGHNDGETAGGRCTGCGGPSHDHPEAGPFLRLSIDAPSALSWWPKPGTPTHEPVHGSVVLDEAAVRQLVADLTTWLEQPKVRPAGGRS